MLESAVHVPVVRQYPGVRFGKGEQDLRTGSRTPPAAGPEDNVEGIAHRLVVDQWPKDRVTAQRLPVQGRRARPAVGLGGPEAGLTSGVKPHSASQGSRLLG